MLVLFNIMSEDTLLGILSCKHIIIVTNITIICTIAHTRVTNTSVFIRKMFEVGNSNNIIRFKNFMFIKNAQINLGRIRIL